MLNLPWVTFDRALAVAAILLGFYWYLKTRRFRSLQCIFGPIGTFELPFAASIAGHETKQLSVIRARLQNAGTEPLTREAMVHRPQLIFDEGSRILSAEVIKQPSTSPATCEVTGHRIVCDFALLNYRGDYFEIQVVVDGVVKRHPRVEATVLGLKPGVQTIVSPTDERLTSKREAKAAVATVVGTLFTLIVALGIAYSFIAQTLDLWPFNMIASSESFPVLVLSEILDGSVSLSASSEVLSLYRPNLSREGFRYTYRLENAGKASVDVTWSDRRGNILLRAVIRPYQSASAEVRTAKEPTVSYAFLRYGRKRREIRTVVPNSSKP